MSNTTKALIAGAGGLAAARFYLMADWQKSAIFAGAAMALVLILAEFPAPATS